MSPASSGKQAPSRDLAHPRKGRRSRTLPGADGRRFTYVYAEGDGADAARGLVLPAGRSLSGQVLASGEPVTTEDSAADERASEAARSALSHIGPAVVSPLGVPGNVRGVLTAGRRHGSAPFPPGQVEVVASPASSAASCGSGRPERTTRGPGPRWNGGSRWASAKMANDESQFERR